MRLTLTILSIMRPSIVIGDVPLQDRNLLPLEACVPSLRRPPSSSQLQFAQLPRVYFLRGRRIGHCGYDARKASFSVKVRREDVK